MSELKRKTKSELLEICEARNLGDCSGMKKDELIKIISKKPAPSKKLLIDDFAEIRAAQ